MGWEVVRNNEDCFGIDSDPGFGVEVFSEAEEY